MTRSGRSPRWCNPTSMATLSTPRPRLTINGARGRTSRRSGCIGAPGVQLLDLGPATDAAGGGARAVLALNPLAKRRGLVADHVPLGVLLLPKAHDREDEALLGGLLPLPRLHLDHLGERG